MKHEQETIGNLMQYQQLGKFYNLYFKYNGEFYWRSELLWISRGE